MWRPWRKSCGNETNVRSYVPCEQCESSLSMNTYTTLTPTNAISVGNETLLHRTPLIQEQSEALTIKSDCASLSDDEITGSGNCFHIVFTINHFEIMLIGIISYKYLCLHREIQLN